MLHEKVFAIKQVSYRQHLVWLSHLVLIDTNSTAFDESLDLSLAWEDLCMVNSEVSQFDTCFKEALVHIEVWHARKDIKQCLLIKFEEVLLG